MGFINLNQFIDRVEQDIFNDMKSRKSEFEREGTQQIQQAAEFLKVYDTGKLAENSRMKQIDVGKEVMWQFETTNIPYAVAVRNGLGSSRAYGPRKYDVRAALMMGKIYKLQVVSGPKNLLEAGRPRSERALKRRRKGMRRLEKAGYTKMQQYRILRKASQKKTGIKAYEGIPLNERKLRSRT